MEACFQKIFSSSLYSQQQNKWYPQRFLLAHFEATFYFSRTELKKKWGVPFILLLTVPDILQIFKKKY